MPWYRLLYNSIGNSPANVLLERIHLIRIQLVRYQQLLKSRFLLLCCLPIDELLQRSVLISYLRALTVRLAT